MSIKRSLHSVLLASLCLPASAWAATPAATNSPWQQGDWMVRGRAIDVRPDVSSTITPVGGKADFSNTLAPEVDFSYFFTKNIAAELILATTKHHAKDKLSGGDINVGSAWVLPPTLTLQYHYTDLSWAKPYVGAGVNYTMYYDQKPGAMNDIKIKDSFGFALQAGVDVPINDRWSWNADVKKIYTRANADWNGGTVHGDIDLDPWIIGTGVGYRF